MQLAEVERLGGDGIPEVTPPTEKGGDGHLLIVGNQRDSRLLLMTAASDRKNRLRGIEAGADDFLGKPFDEAELLARVRSLVHQKHLNEDLDHAAQALFAIARIVESRDSHHWGSL